MKRIYTTLFIAIMAIGLLMTGCGPTPPDMTGTWASECYLNEEQTAYPEYLQNIHTYTASEWTYEQTSWFDPGCAAAPHYVYDATYDYAIPGEESEGLWQIDSTVTDAGMTVVDELYDAIAGWNAPPQCGYDDWAVGVRKPMLGVDTCDWPSASLNDLTLQVFQINSDGTMSHGLADETPNDGIRETTLSELTYTKQ